jgi:hypothetical protein
MLCQRVSALKSALTILTLESALDVSDDNPLTLTLLTLANAMGGAEFFTVFSLETERYGSFSRSRNGNSGIAFATRRHPISNRHATRWHGMAGGMFSSEPQCRTP